MCYIYFSAFSLFLLSDNEVEDVVSLSRFHSSHNHVIFKICFLSHYYET